MLVTMCQLLPSVPQSAHHIPQRRAPQAESQTRALCVYTVLSAHYCLHFHRIEVTRPCCLTVAPLEKRPGWPMRTQGPGGPCSWGVSPGPLLLCGRGQEPVQHQEATACRSQRHVGHSDPQQALWGLQLLHRCGPAFPNHSTVT